MTHLVRLSLAAALVCGAGATAAAQPAAAPGSQPSLAAASQAANSPQGRQRVGLALGGGAARGIAHVGLLRWFE